VEVILASASPRRKQLLSTVISDFEVIASGADENVDMSDPLSAVKELSLKKAKYVFERCSGDCLVIGADTTVVFDGRVFGKPADAGDARRMLSALSGNRHTVLTAVTLIRAGGCDTFADGSEVYFKKLTQKQIDGYIASGNPFDKAGAYGIQDSGFVEKIIGSYTNVMGLPMEMLEEHLKRIGGNNGKF